MGGRDRPQPDDVPRLVVERERLAAAREGDVPAARAVERPVYDELMAEQIATAKSKGDGDLAALLGSGDTWSI